MKKKIVLFFLCAACALGLCVSANAATVQPSVRQEETGYENYEDYLLDDSWMDFFDDQTFSLKDLQGKSFGEIVSSLWDQLLDELQAPMKTAFRIIAVLFLLSIFRALCKESASAELEYTLQSVMTVVLFLLLSPPILQLLDLFKNSIEECRVFLAQFIPVMGSILAAGGQAGTAAVYTTVFFSVIMAVSQALYTWSGPLIRMFMALSITRGMSGSLQLDGFVQLLKKIIHWGLGLTATLFGAYLSFQSVLANAADSLAMKAGKFVLSGGIPIVGGAVSDAIGTVYAGLKLVKSAAGTVGIIGLLLIFLPNLIRCLVYTWVCRFCSAAAQLMDNAPAKGLLDGMADSLSMLNAVLVLYMMMTVLSAALMVLLNTGGT